MLLRSPASGCPPRVLRSHPSWSSYLLVFFILLDGTLPRCSRTSSSFPTSALAVVCLPSLPLYCLCLVAPPLPLTPFSNTLMSASALARDCCWSDLCSLSSYLLRFLLPQQVPFLSLAPVPFLSLASFPAASTGALWLLLLLQAFPLLHMRLLLSRSHWLLRSLLGALPQSLPPICLCVLLPVYAPSSIACLRRSP